MASLTVSVQMTRSIYIKMAIMVWRPMGLLLNLLLSLTMHLAMDPLNLTLNRNMMLYLLKITDAGQKDILRMIVILILMWCVYT